MQDKNYTNQYVDYMGQAKMRQSVLKVFNYFYKYKNIYYQSFNYFFYLFTYLLLFTIFNFFSTNDTSHLVTVKILLLLSDALRLKGGHYQGHRDNIIHLNCLQLHAVHDYSQPNDGCPDE